MIETSTSGTLRKLYLEYRQQKIHKITNSKFCEWKPNRELTNEEINYLKFFPKAIQIYRKGVIKSKT